MPKDLTVSLEDRPGQLAMLGEMLGTAKVNLLGACAVTAAGKGTIHLLVDDKAVDATKRALQGAGVWVQGEREVLVKKIADRPGALGKLTRKLAAAGVNVDLLYLATETRAVFGVNDMEKAKKALAGR